jgi:hypothetical protein
MQAAQCACAHLQGSNGRHDMSSSAAMMVGVWMQEGRQAWKCCAALRDDLTEGIKLVQR